ncbi:MAG: NAD(+) diphosphatase [Dehalococcoidia bacterium]
MAAANVYGGDGLDRLVERRRDTAWWERALKDEATRFIVGWRDRFPVVDTPEGPRLAPFAERDLATLVTGEPVLLGAVEEALHVAIDAGDTEEDAITAALPAGARLADLREVGSLLPGAEAAMAASHRGVLLWHGVQRHCGRCGAPTMVGEAGHVLTCTNHACGSIHHPRIDPAVITLVASPDGERVLLGRNRRRPGAIYTCFAGFVEAGESLEGAVTREVFEEVGVRLSDVRYHSSQPWPFPAQLMLGFLGTATALEIRLDDEEIADARWFTRDELRHLPPDGSVQLPRADAVARRMVDAWIEGEL